MGNTEYMLGALGLSDDHPLGCLSMLLLGSSAALCAGISFYCTNNRAALFEVFQHLFAKISALRLLNCFVTIINAMFCFQKLLHDAP